MLKPFIEQAEAGHIVTSHTIHQACEERVGHPVHINTIYALLHRHGWRKLMPRPQHPQADAAAQAHWKETFEDEVTTIIERRNPDDTRPVVLMVQDEARFGRISEVQRAWAPPGVRPEVPAQMVHESLYAFVAVAPATGELSSLVLPQANTEMMNLFLA